MSMGRREVRKRWESVRWGRSFAEIASEEGESIATVRRWARTLGAPVKRCAPGRASRISLTAEDMELSGAELGRKYGISRNWASILKRRVLSGKLNVEQETTL
jgi:hypothetical protein